MLKKMINRYVELKHAMGFKFRNQNCLLQHFAAFAEQQGDTYVRCKTALEWAKQAPSAAQKRNRYLTVRRFAMTMYSQDKRYERLPVDAFGHATSKRRRPRILSSEELKRLLIAASELKPVNTLRPITYGTLFALLAATGLRISEALALNLSDITDEGLIIRATKCRKDRLVPIHKTVRHGLCHYLNCRSKYSGRDPALLISNKGTRLCYPTVISFFLQLVRSIGLRDGPGHLGVCIHDLRHRFAVRSLEQCGSNPTAISEHMTALSAYLGHAHISDTYWYLHATPQLMKQIATTQELFYRRNNND